MLSSSLKEIFKEVKTGVLLFLLTSYILLTVPQFLAESSAMSLGDATVLVAVSVGLATLIFSLLSKLPGVMGPGIAITAFLIYNLHISMGISYSALMALSFLVGLTLLALTLSGLREEFARAFPKSLRIAILAGIGLYMVFLGVQKAGLLDSSQGVLFNLSEPKTLVVIFTLMSAVILFNAGVPGSFLAAVLLGLMLASAFGLNLQTPEVGGVSLPKVGIDFDSLRGVPILSAFLSIFLIVFFDTLGVGTSLAYYTGKSMNVLRDVFRADALATMLNAFIGIPPAVLFIESTVSGIEKVRGPLPGVIAGILFLLSISFLPVLLLVPPYISSAITIIIGIMLFSLVKFERYEDPSEYVPAVLTMVMMPATMSISQGISFGILAYVFLKLFTGKSRDVSPLMYVLALLIILDAFRILYL